MSYRLRHGAFETNSSSSHSVSIQPVTDQIVPWDELRFAEILSDGVPPETLGRWDGEYLLVGDPNHAHDYPRYIEDNYYEPNVYGDTQLIASPSALLSMLLEESCCLLRGGDPNPPAEWIALQARVRQLVSLVTSLPIEKIRIHEHIDDCPEWLSYEDATLLKTSPEQADLIDLAQGIFTPCHMEFVTSYWGGETIDNDFEDDE